jgi:hypothetical protein
MEKKITQKHLYLVDLIQLLPPPPAFFGLVVQSIAYDGFRASENAIWPEVTVRNKFAIA